MAPAAAALAGAALAAGSTCTKVPRRPRFWNLTTPPCLAKRVSSLPRPTLVPGKKRVPRWRTMIEPPLTSSPPKRLTPRCCGLESRPLRLEPCPFFCAMSSCSLSSGVRYRCVRRLRCLRQLDLVDADAGVVLAMADRLALRVALLVLEHPDLRALRLADQRRGDQRPLDQRLADRSGRRGVCPSDD